MAPWGAGDKPSGGPPTSSNKQPWRALRPAPPRPNTLTPLLRALLRQGTRIYSANYTRGPGHATPSHAVAAPTQIYVTLTLADGELARGDTCQTFRITHQLLSAA